MEKTFPLFWIPLLPLLGAAFNLLVGRKMSRRAVYVVGCGTVIAACVMAFIATFGHLFHLWAPARAADAIPRLINPLFDWITAGTVDIKMGLVFDPLTAVMVITITFVGALIHIYSTGYMSHEKDYARFFGYLNLFTGAMLILVLGDSLLVLFVGWEGVGLCSYLLIGFWYGKDGTKTPGDANATAGRKAFLVNRVGDFAFILGMFVLFYFTGTLNIEELAGKASALMGTMGAIGFPTITVAGGAALLLLIGATGKSAQIPLFVWLPDAMAGPTPVSALIHAATMVTAGVYMVVRLNFVYMLTPSVMGVVALVGAGTALFAATIGFAQNDIKKVLAYSTISQLGYMFLGVGVGAFSAGVFHLFTHAFFKACLFLCAGSVIHAMSGRQDIREMGGLAKKTPVTHGTFLVSCLAISGIPLFSGFFSKDEILWKAFSQVNPAWPSWFSLLVYILGVLAALCTAFYMFRLYYLTFSGECRADEEVKHHIHESPKAMTMPLVVLATGAALLGFLGLPGVLGEHTNLFHNWLAPVVERGAAIAAQANVATVHAGHHAHNHGMEWGLMGLSVAIALISWLFFARRYYLGGYSSKIERLVAGIPRLHKLIHAKYWVDEIYNALIVVPLRYLSRFCSDAIDFFLIDFLAVNGTAKLVDWAGQSARYLQTGNIQRYVVGLVTGAAVVIFFFVGFPDSDFTIKPGDKVEPGQDVQFEARIKPTPRRRLEYQWDFDGDGTWDTGWQQSPNASFKYDKERKYVVRLKMRERVKPRGRWRVNEGTQKLVVAKKKLPKPEATKLPKAAEKPEVQR
jgi:NADH-quinone oxidoreductase subunit L